jgi:hypothetical protein
MSGFQSTSIDPTAAARFTSSGTAEGVLLEIKPTTGGYIGRSKSTKVPALSEHFDEWEFVLPSGKQYVVRGVRDVPITTRKYSGVLDRYEDTETTYRVIQLEMLP